MQDESETAHSILRPYVFFPEINIEITKQAEIDF